MLKELAIHNFAIIRELEIGFQDGLNVLSGETGAGKSILVGAINLILGSRASQEMIRSGAAEAAVEAVLAGPPGDICRGVLDGWGIERGAELTIRRSISRTGRNRVFINDQAVSVQQLQQLSPLLISISGQHEHQLLLDPEVHLGLLDAFGGLDPLCGRVRESWSAWLATKDELSRARRAREQRAAQLDFLLFQLQELEAAKIQPHEDEELGREREILKNAAVLSEAAQKALGSLYADRGAVLERLAEIEKELFSLTRIDPAQGHMLEYLDQARINLKELSHLIQQYSGRIVFNPARLSEVEERLALLGRLGKKYGSSADEMLARLKELRGLVGQEAESGFREEEIERKLEEHRRQYLDLAGELSRKRSEASGRLATEVERNLAELDMPRARFAAQFTEGGEGGGREPLFSPAGMDRVEFLLSANPGEDLKPLAKVASGGELSRILLALKSLLSRKGEAETLIFDEVDAGIGGRTAELVGLQLKKLAGRHQVICITHLPQIACHARWHYLVKKEAGAGGTATSIQMLADGERCEELARMLGGVSISDKVREHAKELLEKAMCDRRQ
ncbi:MAG: DNA repair protein RecN [Syntrophobacteraceae bacterium]